MSAVAKPREMTGRERQYAGLGIVKTLPSEHHVLVGKMRARGFVRMRALWAIPKQDFDLWFCGKVEYRDGL